MNDIDLVVGISAGNVQQQLTRIESQIKKSADTQEKILNDAYEEGIEKGARIGSSKANTAIVSNLRKTGADAGKSFSTGFGSSFTNAFRSSGSTVQALGQSFKSAAVSVPGLGVAIAAVGTAALATFKVIGDGVEIFKGFETAIAEVNTILPENQMVTQDLINQFDDLSVQFGTSSQEQVKAYYQIISAGTTDATDATNLLAAANTLAQGGLTDISSSIDVLTTAINVYGSETLSAAQASDSLFTTVRLGKTTAEELTSALGPILPLAREAGVSFNEVNAALATLTSNGIETSQAATQLQAFLSAVAKRGSELGEGLDFASLRADGLSTFLNRLRSSVNGSEQDLFKLLGRVEATSFVLNTTGESADKLTSNLDAFSNSAGAAAAASAEIGATGDVIDNRLNSSYERFAKILGEAVTPAINSLKTAAIGTLDVLNDLFTTDSDEAQEQVNGLIAQIGRLQQAAENSPLSGALVQQQIEDYTNEVVRLRREFNLTSDVITNEFNPATGDFTTQVRTNLVQLGDQVQDFRDNFVIDTSEPSPLAKAVALSEKEFDEIIKDTTDGLNKVQGEINRTISSGNDFNDIGLRVRAQFDQAGLEANLKRVTDQLQNQDVTLSDSQRAALLERQTEISNALAGISTITLNRQRDFAEKIVSETLKGSTGIIDKINEEFNSNEAGSEFNQIEVDTRAKFNQEDLQNELTSVRDTLSQSSALRLTAEEIESLRERESQITESFKRIDSIVATNQEAFRQRTVSQIVGSGTGSFQAIDNAIAQLNQRYMEGLITEEAFANQSFILQERRQELALGSFEQFRTQSEIINDDEKRLIEELNTVRDAGVISEQRYQTQLTKIRTDANKARKTEAGRGAKERKAIEDTERKQTLESLDVTASAIGDFYTVAQAIAGEDKQAQKQIAIANAIINTGVAVSRSLASAPAPLNLIPAAAALASGIATVRAIQNETTPSVGGGSGGISSSSFGGGSGSPGNQNSAVQNSFVNNAAVPDSPTLQTPTDQLANARQSVINVNFQGPVLGTTEGGLEIIRLIQEASETTGAQLPGTVVAS